MRLLPRYSMKTLEGRNPSARGAYAYIAESGYGLGRSIVTMVQPAESGQGLNLALTRRADFRRPTCWRVLRESKMRPVLVIVEQVGGHQPFEMALIQDNHVVQQVASATSNPALRNTVLPRAAKGRARWLASHVPHSQNYIGAKLCVAVE